MQRLQAKIVKNQGDGGMRRSVTGSGRKYGNKKTTVQGVTFDSKAEARYYLGLLADKQKGLIQEIELQPSFLLQPKFEKNGKKHRAIIYQADFKVTYSDGRVEIIDVKGTRTRGFDMKYKMFEYLYRDLQLTIVKA